MLCFPTNNSTISSRIYILGLLCLMQWGLFLQPLHARKYDLSHFTSKEGLPYNNLHDVAQDAQGFMWFTTSNGLLRYDGHEFKIYHSGTHGLTTNLTLSVFVDNQERLWVGTENRGLFLYNPEMDYFHLINDQVAAHGKLPNAIVGLVQGTDSTLWIQSTNRVFHLSYTDSLHYKTSPQSQYLADIKSLTIDDDNIVYIASNRGIFSYNQEEEAFEQQFKATVPRTSHIQIVDGQLYATVVGRLHGVSKEGELSPALVGAGVGKFHITPSGQLFITNNDGLFWYEKEKEQFVFREQLLHRKPLIAFFHEDSFGNIWIGTRGQGLYQMTPKHKHFNNYLEGLTIKTVTQSQDNTIWVASHNGTVTSWKAADSDVTGRLHALEDSVHLDRFIFNASEVNPGEMWFSTYRGAYRHPVGTDQYKLDRKLERGKVRSVVQMVVDSSYVWMVTSGYGLSLVERQSGKPIHKTGEDRDKRRRFTTLVQDHDKNLWLGSVNGLLMLPHANRFSEKATFVQVKSPAHNLTPRNAYITSLMVDSKGALWVGTLEHGVLRFDNPMSLAYPDKYGKPQAKAYRKRNGLCSNYVESILEDDLGQVWIGTKAGLSAILPESKTIYRYTMGDGLLENEFSGNAAVKLHNGALLFGTTNGMVCFHPKNIQENKVLPRMAINDVLVWNEPISLSSSTNARLNLKHDDNHLTFHFVGLSYQGGQKYLYQYRLQGYDKNWVNTSSTQRVAMYTNIPPGEYTFEVRACNSDGYWAKPARVSFVIDPPVWATWYAYIFYCLVLAGAIYFMVSFFRSREARRQELIFARKEKQQIQELADMKMEFFGNVSHEFRTPLTLILTPLQQIMSNPEISRKDMQPYLEVIQHNSSLLLRYINQILDMMKFNANKLDIHLTRSDIVPYVQYVMKQFEAYAHQQQVQLETVCEMPSRLMVYDQYMMEEIIYNLVSNAIKHTPANGLVHVEVEDQEGGIAIHVSDSGKGMSVDVQNHLFERFYSKEVVNAHGTGIGLSMVRNLVKLHNGTISFHSEEGQGTTFTIFIPDALGEGQDVDTVEVNAQTGPLIAATACSYQPVEMAEDNTATYSEEQSALTKPLQGEESTTDKPHILVVDDNVQLLDMLTDILRSQYQVVTALNGREGWEKCQRQLPVMVISDIMMPVMGGLELCRLIKTTQATSHIPVILLTADTRTETHSEGMTAHADAFCVKPFQRDVLLSTIASILHNRQKAIERFNTRQYIDAKKDAATAMDVEFIDKVTSLVEENMLKSEYTVKALCQELGLSQITVNKKLKALTDMTANAFIRHLRLERAKKLMAEQKYNITEVTYMVGFSDLRYFRRCFKEKYGILPSDFVKEIADEDTGED